MSIAKRLIELNLPTDTILFNIMEENQEPEKTPVEKGFYWLTKLIGIVGTMEKQLAAYKTSPNCNERIVSERTELITNLKHTQDAMAGLLIEIEYGGKEVKQG